MLHVTLQLKDVVNAMVMYSANSNNTALLPLLELEPLDQALLCSKKSPRSMYTVTQGLCQLWF